MATFPPQTLRTHVRASGTTGSTRKGSFSAPRGPLAGATDAPHWSPKGAAAAPQSIDYRHSEPLEMGHGFVKQIVRVVPGTGKAVMLQLEILALVADETAEK